MSVDLEVKKDSWWVNGIRRADLDDCIDLDLELSPITNTFPIRRAHPRIRETIRANVAWVRFPSLKVQAFGQSYTRLNSRIYRYRSNSGFSAKILVDKFGLVNRYGDIWKRIG